MATPLVAAGPLQPPVFNGTVVQCQEAVISWTVGGLAYEKASLHALTYFGLLGVDDDRQGGEFPVRVQAFYQNDSTSDWKNAGAHLPSIDRGLRMT